MQRLASIFTTAAAVSALLVLGASGASAQSSMSSPPSATGSHSPAASSGANSSAGTAASATPMKDPLASEDISQIDGVSVADRDGSSVGKISTVLMNPSTKKVDRLVVAEGGILGVGAHNVALPVDAFHWDARNHDFVIQKTADDLKAMPEWQKPQLAEAPTPATSGVASGMSAGAPAGAVSPPVTRDTSNQPAH